MKPEETVEQPSSGPGPSTSLRARRLLILQYEARIPPRSRYFQWPSPQALLQIQDNVDADLFQTHTHGPATAKYQRLMLRELLSRLESSVEAESTLLRADGVDDVECPEVNSLLLERYANLLASSSSGTGLADIDGVPEKEFTTHYWPMSSADLAHSPNDPLLDGYARVVVREEGSAVSKGTTGLKTWEAGLRLAGHIVANPELISAPDTRVIELGAGTGFLGSVCAKVSQHSQISTCLTDVPGQVIARIQDTLKLNGLSNTERVHVQELDWLELQAERQQSEQRDDLPAIQFIQKLRPTLILAADVVYDPDLVGPLAETIRVCLESGLNMSSQALVASTIRNSSTYAAFKVALETQNLSAIVVPLTRREILLEDESTPALSLFPSAHDPGQDGTVELLRITL